jgi:hypothetical protein
MPAEYGTNAKVVLPDQRPFCGRTGPDTSGKFPPGEDGMDFDKDNFDDETELSPLEEEELGGETEGLVETEEEELIVTEEEPEEEAPKPAKKAAPKKAAAKKAPAKKAKKAAPKKKAAKKPAKKAAKKATKKKKKR